MTNIIDIDVVRRTNPTVCSGVMSHDELFDIFINHTSFKIGGVELPQLLQWTDDTHYEFSLQKLTSKYGDCVTNSRFGSAYSIVTKEQSVVIRPSYDEKHLLLATNGHEYFLSRFPDL